MIRRDDSLKPNRISQMLLTSYFITNNFTNFFRNTLCSPFLIRFTICKHSKIIEKRCIVVKLVKFVLKFDVKFDFKDVCV